METRLADSGTTTFGDLDHQRRDKTDPWRSEIFWSFYLRDKSPWFTEYRPGDSGFFALLGCPNDKGVVRMLTDHCDALGRKTIACVRVLATRGSVPPTFFFVLADCKTEAPAKGFKRSATGQRRAEKRLKRSILGTIDR